MLSSCFYLLKHLQADILKIATSYITSMEAQIEVLTGSNPRSTSLVPIKRRASQRSQDDDDGDFSDSSDSPQQTPQIDGSSS
jgi:hypothetical protein